MHRRAIMISSFLVLLLVAMMIPQPVRAEVNYDHTLSDEVGDVYGEDSHYHPEIEMIDIELLTTSMVEGNITVVLTVKGEIESTGDSEYSIDCMVMDSESYLDFSLMYNGTFSSSYPAIETQMEGVISGSQLIFRLPLSSLPPHSQFSPTYVHTYHIGEMEAQTGKTLGSEDTLDPSRDGGEIIEDGAPQEAPISTRLVYRMEAENEFLISYQTQLEGDRAHALREGMDEDENGEIDTCEYNSYLENVMNGSQGLGDNVGFSLTINGKVGNQEVLHIEMMGAEGPMALNETITLSAELGMEYDLDGEPLEIVRFENALKDKTGGLDGTAEMSFTLLDGWTMVLDTVDDWLKPYITEDNGSFTISDETLEDIHESVHGLEFHVEGPGEDVEEDSLEGMDTGEKDTIVVGDDEVDVSVEEVDESEGTVNLTVGGEDVELGIGESKELDTDGDGEKDMEVTLEDIDDEGAKLKFDAIEKKDDDDTGLPGFEVPALLCAILLLLMFVKRSSRFP